MRKTLLLTSLASLGACSSLTPIDDPVYLRINDLEARLIRIERVLENESLISLATDIASLRTEVQSLLGQVETLGFEVERQGTSQRDLYVDLDQRLADIEAAQQRLASMPVSAAAGAAAVNDQQAYDAAFALIGQQNFAAAQTAFESFLGSYPASSLRSNAQYWLAETHYGQLSFQTAIAEFQRVIDSYPESAKVPDALLKIAFSNFNMGNFSAARQGLLRVMREFPDTPVATAAEDKLGQIPE
ncbi:MAG TPA: tol-pal system protein YbgF [Vicinamibacterales bacterium]|nr:tol-pal system protein YbgF [Vicinamibacterales bacterium]